MNIKRIVFGLENRLTTALQNRLDSSNCDFNATLIKACQSTNCITNATLTFFNLSK